MNVTFTIRQRVRVHECVKWRVLRFDGVAGGLPVGRAMRASGQDERGSKLNAAALAYVGQLVQVRVLSALLVHVCISVRVCFSCVM